MKGYIHDHMLKKSILLSWQQFFANSCQD